MLALPFLLLLAFVAALGVGLWLSALNVEYRDVRYVVPFLVQLWLFVTPVIYPSSSVAPALDRLGLPSWLVGLNPMAGVVEGFRWALLGTGSPPGPAAVRQRRMPPCCSLRRRRSTSAAWRGRSPMWSEACHRRRRALPTAEAPMNDLAVRVERIWASGTASASASATSPCARASADAGHRRRLRGRRRRDRAETIWALRDVSFEVAARARSSASSAATAPARARCSRSSSRITEPTEGRAEIHGRVGSLLEVGTGFHPELTGRENIFLNGAILGMKRAEIARKFDEIVAFAEVEQFLDTPVKHYSSGMYVRLAFAVAAHLEPEILLVDEVLAVGDAAFQRKCLGKMEDVASRAGRCCS